MAGARDFSLGNIQTGSGAHTASCLMSSCLGVKQLEHEADLHLVLRSRMSGAIPLPHLYTFMVWTGTTLLFFLPFMGEFCYDI
jgi:hypothetical protein